MVKVELSGNAWREIKQTKTNRKKKRHKQSQMFSNDKRKRDDWLSLMREK